MAAYLAAAGRLDLLPRVAIKLGRRQIDGMDELFAQRATRETGGDKEGMRHRLMAYALANMPEGWAPPDGSDDDLRGLTRVARRTP